MRKFIYILLCAALFLSYTATTVNAHNEGELSYTVDGYVHSFEFEDDTLTLEEKIAIAETILGIRNGSVAPCSSSCIDGHDYESTYVYKTTHKVRATSPRCNKTTYNLKQCSVCGYTTTEYVDTVKIFCCPEQSTQ